MKLSFPFSLLLIFNFFSADAQDLPLGSWRVHLPYLSATCVTEAGNKMFCVADKGLFYYDKEDGSVNRLSKVTGLSDNDIDIVNYNPAKKVLMIAYSNANIDLLYDDKTIINIPDLKNANVTGNKKNINHIFFYGEYAYLSCGFGVLVVNLNRHEIKETYYLGSAGTKPAVYGIAVDDVQNIYAASDSGVYMSSLNNPALNNFANWTKIYTGAGRFDQCVYFSGRLVVNQYYALTGADTVWTYQGGTWTSYNGDINKVNSIKACYDKLIITFAYNVLLVDQNYQHIDNIYWANYKDPHTSDAIVDKDNLLWIADNWQGLIKYHGTNSIENILPNGPKSALVSGLDAAGDYIWVSHGPVAAGGILQNQFRPAIISNFMDGAWTSYNQQNTDNNICNMNDIWDLTCIVSDPADPDHVYTGSYDRGVLEFNDGNLLAWYNRDNTGGVLQHIQGTDFIRVGGLALDDEKRLWVGVAGVPNMLCVKKEDGTWKGYTFGGVLKNTDYLGAMLIDDFGQKWCINVNANDLGGIFVFNDNYTPDDLSDDHYRLLLDKSGAGGLPSKDVRSLAKDMDGSIWVGTGKGVAVFYSPSAVFSSGGFDAQQVLIQYGGYNQYLLETEIVTAIAIDGANRKWFGTQNGGVFLMSADGTKQLANFNISNSPILSNYILRITINKKTGEVFFGTDKGIISYRGTATEGTEGCSDTYVYPNPVTEDYAGPIAVKGLAANSNVKITDISGTVIYETKAEGGQAIWDGRSLNGDKAHTGVYLIFCSDENGDNTCVTKMVFIN